MSPAPPSQRRSYSRAEYLSDAAIHVAGLAAAVGAVPVVIVLAALHRGDAAALTGVSVYGATLILMFVASALYHMVRRPGWGRLLLRLDHAAIFLKIAGTYTVFALLAGESFGLTAALWGVAAAGVALEVLTPRPRRSVSTLLYLGMGWAVILGGGAILAVLPVAAVVLMAVGGGLYTVGVVFNHWQRLPFHNTIWHVFVLTATGLFYAAVIVEVVQG